MFINNSNREGGDKCSVSKTQSKNSEEGGMTEEQSPTWGAGFSPKALSGQVSRNPPKSMRKERGAARELNGQVRRTANS